MQDDVNVHDHIALTEYGPNGTRRYEYAWRGDYLHAFLISDVGRKRENNEDSCLLCVPDDPKLARQRGYLVAVADGMGGASAGEFASRMALRQTANAHFLSPAERNPDALREAVENANLKVFEEAELHPELSGMGTTISVLVVHGGWAYAAQVGDSRIYLKRPGQPLLQITHDHSLVAEQMRCGLITADEARNHTMKNLITRAVGIKEAVKVDMFAFGVQRGDTVLICSDGLCNMVTDETIDRLLARRELAVIGQALVEAALEEGGPDNITAALLRVTAHPWESDLEPGADLVTLPRAGIVNRLRRWFA